MIPGLSNRRRFADLSEREVLALAISCEEDDARIYRSYAERLRAAIPRDRRAVRRHGPRRTATASA
jgi:erythrin-vacuolar iron transport family protein